MNWKKVKITGGQIARTGERGNRRDDHRLHLNRLRRSLNGPGWSKYVSQVQHYANISTFMSRFNASALMWDFGPLIHHIVVTLIGNARFEGLFIPSLLIRWARYSIFRYQEPGPHRVKCHALYLSTQLSRSFRMVNMVKERLSSSCYGQNDSKWIKYDH